MLSAIGSKVGALVGDVLGCAVGFVSGPVGSEVCCAVGSVVGDAVVATDEKEQSMSSDSTACALSLAYVNCAEETVI